MATSQNGYSANDRSVIASFVIPGTDRKVALRKGDCAVLLLDFLAWFDVEIESIDGGQLDDWGYAERPIRGSTTTLSNHASGTGVDINALLHALGKRGTFTPEQTAKIRAKLAEYDGCLRWGGDYTGRADEMHIEINKGALAVKVVADRIMARGGPGAPGGDRPPSPHEPHKPPPPPPHTHVPPFPGITREGMRSGVSRAYQQRLKDRGWNIVVDGKHGPATTAILRKFQAEKGLQADGVGGENTWNALWTAPR